MLFLFIFIACSYQRLMLNLGLISTFWFLMSRVHTRWVFSSFLLYLITWHLWFFIMKAYHIFMLIILLTLLFSPYTFYFTFNGIIYCSRMLPFCLNGRHSRQSFFLNGWESESSSLGVCVCVFPQHGCTERVQAIQLKISRNVQKMHTSIYGLTCSPLFYALIIRRMMVCKIQVKSLHLILMGVLRKLLWICMSTSEATKHRHLWNQACQCPCR